MISGVPLRKIDQTENVIEFDLERSIKDKIIGQDKAVDAVVNAIQRNKTGLKDPNKPIGSFIFLGQTGIGKTQLAKSLGEELKIKVFAMYAAPLINKRRGQAGD